MDTSQEQKSYEMVPITTNSPSDTHITEENALPDDSPSTSTQSSRFKSICKVSGIFVVLVLLGLLTTQTETISKQPISASLQETVPSVFEFDVYCPISYYGKNQVQCKNQIVRPLQPGSQTDNDLRRLEGAELLERTVYCKYTFDLQTVRQNFDDTKIYIIRQESYFNQTSKQYQLTYCGLARQWNGDCANARQICSSPGPMFDVNVFQSIDVIWINKLKKEDADTNDTICSGQAQFCHLQKKPALKLKETYFHPTDLQSQTVLSSQSISFENWPTSTHVHGLQVRPTFDGNPLSWIDNKGNRGLGAQSLSDSCYYGNFDEDLSKKFTPQNYLFADPKLNQVAKINRYPNTQNPGNLWYHDHAMRSTKYNAQHGLAGSYIIRDPEVEKVLPNCDYQRYIMKTVQGWSSQPFPHQAGVYYRYRILNNDPSQKITISFREQCKVSSPAINFTIIGADSSLFHEPMWQSNGKPITQVQLGSAQRIQALIKFEQGKHYSICDANLTPSPKKKNNQRASIDGNDDELVAVSTISVSPRVKKNERASLDPQNCRRIQTIPTELNVPFTNLAEITQDKIAVKRMRPLIIRDRKFMVNGHFSFHKGASQNPTIGTIEDWYIINTAGGQHPIHVHLINFQVIEIRKLRLITVDEKTTVSLYELQFWLEALKLAQTDRMLKLKQKYFLEDGIIDYLAFAKFVTDGTSDTGFKAYSNQFMQLAYNVNKENELNDSVEGKPKISGIDVQLQVQEGRNKSFDKIWQFTNCKDEHQYKYVCQPQTITKEWYTRWKDTAYVDGSTYFKYRIRWTKSNYNEEVDTEHFHVPADQLRQFPGFVYHCHILAHEDNEMMRPIMLELPKNYQSTYSYSVKNQQCSSTVSWQEKFQCLNKACQVKGQRRLTNS